jgi:hypothetical protein
MNHQRRLQSAIVRALSRVFLAALIAGGIFITPRPQLAEDCGVAAGCKPQPKIDIAFMLDRSGSMAQHGQTWNIIVDGVIRALRDRTIVPRDGSIAVCVVAFNGGANITVPLTDINSADDANKVIALVEKLKCPGDIHSQVFPCPFGETSWFSGILVAGNHINQMRQANPKPGTRRVLLLVSDGSTTPADLDQSSVLAEQTRNDATTVSIRLTFNAFLMGVDPGSPGFATSKAALDQIVTPKNPQGPLGTTTVINPGPCNLEGASSTGDDCTRQSLEFAEATRTFLRSKSDFPNLALQVTLDGDTVPGAPPAKSGPSLRQAIEAANCNGAGIITFSPTLKGRTISLLTPLPALASPDIVIDGCDPADSPGCTPLVTIDGGGTLADGIWIRSNRDIVRGLRIINFTHAGVLIAPFCPTDNISRNVVERNVLENNPAGVVVSDQKGAPRDGFNEQNTISRNNISRIAPPSTPTPPALIDLGGDGPTDNDAGDADSGPNTLLNFPNSLNVVSAPNGTVTITGDVSGPAAGGATIDLYAITSSHIVSGKVVVDGVTFLAQTGVGSCAIAAGGASCTFTATEIPVSPTGNYTATVTDLLGNTSELMFRADGKPAAGPDAAFPASVDFGDVNLNSTPQSKQVQITNTGNAPLQIAGCSIVRCVPADKDDTARFSISGCPDPATQINPGEHATITVTFATNLCGTAKSCLVLTGNDPLHAPISTTLTGQVVALLVPTVALEGNASALSFGPVNARSQRRGDKKVIKKQPFHTFTIDNKSCGAFNVAISAIKRVTDVPKCISPSSADDKRQWVLTLFNAGIETVFTPGVTGAISMSPGDTLTFRVRFNPSIPAVVNKTCPDGKLTADEVLPDTVDSVITIAVFGEVSNTLAVPLTGQVIKELRLIDPNDPSQSPAVSLCRSGNDFIAQFSVYDSNQNVDRAEFQFMDSAGRIVGQVINVTGLDQAVAGRNLAPGQSFTIVQRFTGAADNPQVANVQVRVFDKDGASDAFLSGAISSSCAGVSAQLFQRASSVVLPDAAVSGSGRPGKRTRDSR